MKKRKPSNHKKRNIILLILLAALCIGGAELAACRHFDPALYEQVTAPVRAGAHAVVSLCRSGAARVSQFWDDLAARIAAAQEQPEEPEAQLASDPALTNSAPISDPAVTDLQVVSGREVLTGGLFNVVYFNQGDDAWAEQPYGSDQIGGYGCGPTAMAMAVATLTGVETNPADMAQWAAEHGYWARKSGSYLSIVEGTAAAYGLQAESFSSRTPEAVQEALLSGKLLVALVGPGHFTQRGHFILLRGVTLSGDILVADPNSTQRSLTAWEPQLILDELSASTSNGAPLWALSADLP